MGQIIVNKNAVGTVGLGVFLLGIGVFAFSSYDPSFGPIANVCIVGGAVVAGLLLRRRPSHPSIDPHQLDSSQGAAEPPEGR